MSKTNERKAAATENKVASELVKRFNLVKPSVGGIKVGKDTRIGKGILSIGTIVTDFNITAYRSRTDLTLNQQAWADKFDENDGFVPCVIASEPEVIDGVNVPAKNVPFNSWLSTLRGLSGVTVDGDKLIVKAGSKYRMEAGVLMIA